MRNLIKWNCQWYILLKTIIEIARSFFFPGFLLQNYYHCEIKCSGTFSELLTIKAQKKTNTLWKVEFFFCVFSIVSQFIHTQSLNYYKLYQLISNERRSGYQYVQHRSALSKCWNVKKASLNNLQALQSGVKNLDINFHNIVCGVYKDPVLFLAWLFTCHHILSDLFSNSLTSSSKRCYRFTVQNVAFPKHKSIFVSLFSCDAFMCVSAR